MYWSVAVQAIAAGLGAALPVCAAIVWVIRKVFSLGEWKGTLATKKDLDDKQQATKQDMDASQQATKRDMDALQQATRQDMDALQLATTQELAAMQQANDQAHAGITKRLDETRTEVSELKATVAVLASNVEATRSDVGRILDHLLDSKET